MRRPDGRLLFRDTTRLRPGDDLASLGLLGTCRAIGALYVVSHGLTASVFDTVMTHCDEMGWLAGCSDLPNAAGCWFRVVAPDARSANSAVTASWSAARRTVLGFGPPVARRC